MPFYSRKSPRIPNYDYSSQNYYFITICTHDRKCVFGSPTNLNRFGKVAQAHIKKIEAHYENVHIEKYVVMPNHIHMIMVLDDNQKVNAEQVIGQLKSGVTRECRKIKPDVVLWQRSFHDHIIRDQKSYEGIWSYIENNPQCWDKDCFYTDQMIVTELYDQV